MVANAVLRSLFEIPSLIAMKSYEARTVKQLIGCHNAGERIKYVFFWGHTPPHDGSINQACFSQWYDAPFELDDILFPTSEHYMMAQKALLFEDKTAYESILNSAHPGEAKSIGRTVQNFNQSIWDGNRFEIVVKANYYKFSQNEPLKQYLLNTSSRVLVEASPRDTIWGIGLAQNHPKAELPHAWKGLNLLGFALMEARKRLGENHPVG